MATKFIPDGDTSDFVDGVDRHYYEKQLGGSSVFESESSRAFKLAAARAKDKARHKLIRAIQEEDRRIRHDTFLGIGDFTGQAKQNVLAQRTIDGVEGAPDENIKL